MIDYKIIDLKTYSRKAHLDSFMSMQYPQFSITADIDVTELKRFCERENYSFFLSFLHVVALSADSIPQLRQRIHMLHDGDGAFEIREYSQCPTSHTEATGNELYCYCNLHHRMPWDEYISAATELQQKAREQGRLEEDMEIEAFCFVTCIPWIRYSDITHPMTDRFDSNPRFSWGKYEEDFRGKLMMPLTAAVHHGLVDGIHVGKFYKTVKENITALIEGKLNYY